MNKDNKLIWESIEPKWNSLERDRFQGVDKHMPTVGVKVGGSRADDNSSRYPNEQEVADVVDQFKQLLSGSDGGFLRGVTIPAIDNIFDSLVQRWDMDHMTLFWVQIMQNIGKNFGFILSSYLFDGEPQGHYFNVKYARELADHLRNFRKSATEHLGTGNSPSSSPAQTKKQPKPKDMDRIMHHQRYPGMQGYGTGPGKLYPSD